MQTATMAIVTSAKQKKDIQGGTHMNQKQDIQCTHSAL
jgi:hypothetical protein